MHLCVYISCMYLFTTCPFRSDSVVFLCNNEEVLCIYSPCILVFKRTHCWIMDTRCCSRVIVQQFRSVMCFMGPELLNLDVATLSWAMRDRPTWDQHRVPLRAKHNWFKACSELTFCCNPLRAEEEVLCLQRCSTRLLPAVGCRARERVCVFFFFIFLLPTKSAWQIQLIVCGFIDVIITTALFP